MEKWKRVCVGDVAVMKRGKYVTRKDTRLGNIPVILGGQEPAYYCDESNHEGPCVVISRSGASAGFVSYWDEPIFVTDGFLFEANERCDIRFLYYCLKSNQSLLGGMQNGSGIPHVQGAALKQFPISLPPLPEQRKIADELTAIDRKIALNRKRISTLEAMAKEIYDYWFVQFDFPDAHGRPYKSSGGAMVYNPDLKREIPKGWEVGRLADIAQYSKETVRSDAIDIKHYVTTDSLLQGKKGRVQAANLPPVPVSLVAFQKDDTLVANIRPYLKKIWYATESGGSSQDVLVFHPICGELAPLLHSILWQDDFFDYVMAAAKGSKMPRGDKAHIMDYPIPLPDKKVARRFGESVEKFYAWCECALKETESLISLRDFLLPVLMNGQAKVG